MIFRLLSAAALAGLVPASAAAAVLSFTLPIVEGGAADTYSFDQFDPALGTLTDVSIDVSAAFFASEIFDITGTSTVSVSISFPHVATLMDSDTDTCNSPAPSVPECMTLASASILEAVTPSIFAEYIGSGTVDFVVATEGASYGDFGVTVTYTYNDGQGETASPIPLPAGLPLFGAGLGLLAWCGGRRPRGANA